MTGSPRVGRLSVLAHVSFVFLLGLGALLVGHLGWPGPAARAAVPRLLALELAVALSGLLVLVALTVAVRRALACQRNRSEGEGVGGHGLGGTLRRIDAVSLAAVWVAGGMLTLVTVLAITGTRGATALGWAGRLGVVGLLCLVAAVACAGLVSCWQLLRLPGRGGRPAPREGPQPAAAGLGAGPTVPSPSPFDEVTAPIALVTFDHPASPRTGSVRAEAPPQGWDQPGSLVSADPPVRVVSSVRSPYSTVVPLRSRTASQASPDGGAPPLGQAAARESSAVGEDAAPACSMRPGDSGQPVGPPPGVPPQPNGDVAVSSFDPNRTEVGLDLDELIKAARRESEAGRVAAVARKRRGVTGTEQARSPEPTEVEAPAGSRSEEREAEAPASCLHFTLQATEHALLWSPAQAPRLEEPPPLGTLARSPSWWRFPVMVVVSSVEDAFVLQLFELALDGNELRVEGHVMRSAVVRLREELASVHLELRLEPPGNLDLVSRRGVELDLRRQVNRLIVQWLRQVRRVFLPHLRGARPDGGAGLSGAARMTVSFRGSVHELEVDMQGLTRAMTPEWAG